MDVKRLNGKVAIVTGASRGIGRAIALAFAEEEAGRLVNYYQSKNQANQAVTRIQQMGGKAYAVRADVSQPEEVAKVALFLACDDANWMTGTVTIVDGGESLA